MSKLRVLKPSRARFWHPLAAAGLCVTVAIIFWLVTPKCRHWCVVPITLTGILIGCDAMRWFSRDSDAFDPVAVLGLAGLNAFFLAPLMFMAGDQELLYLNNRLDWGHWIGYMAVLHLIGVACYMVTRELTPFWRRLDPQRWSWSVGPHHRVVFVSMLVVAFLLQLLIYARFGGIAGYVAALGDTDRGDPMAGLGYVLMFSDPFPLLLTMYLAIRWRQQKARPSMMTLLGWTCVMLVLLIFFGGLRGSRASTIWSLLMIVTAVHFYLWPVSKRFLVGLALVAAFFSNVYSIYKYGGVEAFTAVFNPAIRSGAAYEEHSTSFDDMLIGDFSRFPVQSYVLWRLSRAGGYRYARGQTYLDALLLPIPSRFAPRVIGKVEAGTNCLHGPNAWLADAPQGDAKSSRIYGLAGEAMLNFGVVAIPFAFALLGILVKQISVYMTRVPDGDTRRLLIGALIPLTLLLCISDLDNAVWFVAKYCVLALLVLTAASRICRRWPCAY